MEEQIVIFRSLHIVGCQLYLMPSYKPSERGVRGVHLWSLLWLKLKTHVIKLRTGPNFTLQKDNCFDLLRSDRICSAWSLLLGKHESNQGLENNRDHQMVATKQVDRPVQTRIKMGGKSWPIFFGWSVLVSQLSKQHNLTRFTKFALTNPFRSSCMPLKIPWKIQDGDLSMHLVRVIATTNGAIEKHGFEAW